MRDRSLFLLTPSIVASVLNAITNAMFTSQLLVRINFFFHFIWWWNLRPETITIQRQMVLDYCDGQIVYWDKCCLNFLTFIFQLKENPGKKPQPGIESRCAGWEAMMLPLNHLLAPWGVSQLLCRWVMWGCNWETLSLRGEVVLCIQVK